MSMRTLNAMLRATAQRLPSKTALYFGEKTWTYRRLEEDSLRAAAGFAAAGIGRGDRVAIFLKNSPEFVIAVFALAAVGATAVPVNFFSKAEELAFILQDSGASALITHEQFWETAQAALKAAPETQQVWLTAGSALNARPFSELLQAPPLAASAAEENGTVVILYTSGTTGKPKGVMLSHLNLVANAKSCVEALGLVEKDGFMCLLPMFHVFAWTTCVVVPLSIGCGIAIVENIRPPAGWLKLIPKRGVTVFAAVPQIYAVLADQAKGFKKLVLRFYFFRGVRFCISGAAPLLPETWKKFEDRIGAPLLQGYGLSETSPVVSANSLTHHRPGTVGRPFPGVRVKIVDENEKELSAGQEGEICVAGELVMQGYYKNPEATAAILTRDGWLKTGDIGVLDADGYLSIRDRIKDMIIVKGLKVFSVQVENALLEHPAVAEAAVVGIPDPSGDETIKAFVVLKEGAAADKAELLKLCQEKLPAYKRPRDIEFLKELPKNSVQKVLKRELRKRHLAG